MTLADIRPALRAFLLADNAISQAVGSNRIYPEVMPQGEQRPSAVYNLISEVNDHHMQGASGLVMQRIQIDCWATRPDDADNLARLIKGRLDGFRGVMGGGGSPDAGVRVMGAFADVARSRHESEPELFGIERDFLVWFAER